MECPVILSSRVSARLTHAYWYVLVEFAHLSEDASSLSVGVPSAVSILEVSSCLRAAGLMCLKVGIGRQYLGIVTSQL